MKHCRLPRRPRVQKDSPQLAALALVLAAGPHGPGKPEHVFCPGRRWRFDLAWPARMVAFECEGGAWMGRRGRHTSGKGFTDDCEKYSAAAVLGWRVIRATVPQIRSGQAAEWLSAALDVAAGGSVPAGFGQLARRPKIKATR